MPDEQMSDDEVMDIVNAYGVEVRCPECDAVMRLDVDMLQPMGCGFVPQNPTTCPECGVALIVEFDLSASVCVAEE